MMCLHEGIAEIPTTPGASAFPFTTVRSMAMPPGDVSLPDPLPLPVPADQNRHEVMGESELAEKALRLFRKNVLE